MSEKKSIRAMKVYESPIVIIITITIQTLIVKGAAISMRHSFTLNIHLRLNCLAVYFCLWHVENWISGILHCLFLVRKINAFDDAFLFPVPMWIDWLIFGF